MPVTQARHTNLAIIALILGGVGIGTTEFIAMGLLPETAGDLGVSIPAGGASIAAYAVGVVVGAPILAVAGASWPRRTMLAGLLATLAIGNALVALAPNFGLLVGARFLAGLPHGAFFGVASLAAVDLMPPQMAGRAVSRVMLGIPFANLLGVPAGTWLGQQFGWRTAYGVIGGLALISALLVHLVVPQSYPHPDGAMRRELRALKNLQVWLTLLTGAIGFGGMFAMNSYIAPTITEVTKQPASVVPVIMLVLGLGGLVGTPIAGRMADWSILRTIGIGLATLAANLALFTWTSQWLIPAALSILACSICAGMLVVGLQMRLMQVAGDARNLGAASNHAALNVANALGAWLGGAVLAAGYGYTAPSWVGFALALAGGLIFAVSLLVHQRTRVADA
ncbi:MAG: MFS transporter [Actinobacteria bacterium]|uniref:MFS transporter n=1 Tax=Nostocoides veronense TaxID=330836 RepID=A0ABN2M4T5_9MICO|nr:MFS transporter [Actinomycetota bacterium]